MILEPKRKRNETFWETNFLLPSCLFPLPSSLFSLSSFLFSHSYGFSIFLFYSLFSSNFRMYCLLLYLWFFLSFWFFSFFNCLFAVSLYGIPVFLIISLSSSFCNRFVIFFLYLFRFFLLFFICLFLHFSSHQIFVCFIGDYYNAFYNFAFVCFFRYCSVFFSAYFPVISL